ncbi:TetR/AcrR family transcriptional regulator [Streptomyces sp. SID3212]|uniref:TetR/AcrR family transcriptional regulator n=1 Tax=Streptomyces sp. SID3212 TaxID=2690259 RepID=UPI001369DC2E|nr:TetR/AcrR family transcriptional regulator [Streptomyces sp. SID3212]MYV53759.1 TetR family transcriptional regulator [Streptomyces sp. SID3212]
MDTSGTDTTTSPDLAPRRGGRGARERILWAANKLFYEEGINATGMERLTEVAHVSRRTFYQHFPSKNALVDEYLRQLEEETPPGEHVLNRSDLTPRERLLGLFAAPPAGVPLRGCPFHNAAVETAGTLPAVRAAAIHHKERFTQRLTDTAREAGAEDPETLARQLAVLFEGARALTTSVDNTSPLADGRALAATLIDAAIARAA